MTLENEGQNRQRNEVDAVTDIHQSEDEPALSVAQRIGVALAQQAAWDGLNIQLPQIVSLTNSVLIELRLQKYWGVIDGHEECLLGVYAGAADAVQGLGLAREQGYEAAELRTHYASSFEPLSAEDAALVEAAAGVSGFWCK